MRRVGVVAANYSVMNSAAVTASRSPIWLNTSSAQTNKIVFVQSVILFLKK